MKKGLFVAFTVIILVLFAFIFYLLFDKSYTVVFNLDNGTSITLESVHSGGKIDKPAEPVKDGYKFVGWYDGEEEFDFTKKITSNTVITAKWIIPEPDKWTVTFNTDGGTTIPSQTIVDKEKAVAPTTPTKTGYDFVRWEVDGEAFSFETEITKNITVKAIWEVEKVKYTVTFDSKGGSSVASVKVKDGSALAKPTNPSRSGYTFAGWTLNGSAYNFNSAVTKNITLTATWKAVVITYTYKFVKIEESVANEYRLYVTTSGGTVVSGSCTITYTSGTSATKSIPSSGLVINKDVISKVTNCKKG